jgi:hypothetical protein
MWSYHSTVKKHITESGFGIVSADIYKTHLRAQPRANSSEFKNPPSSSTSTFNTSRDITKGVISRIKLF